MWGEEDTATWLGCGGVGGSFLGSGGECSGAAERAVASYSSPAHWLVSDMPALALGFVHMPFSPLCLALFRFPHQFSRVFSPPRTEATLYGACHARIGR